MSLSNARHKAHNLRAKAVERGDTEAAELAALLHDLAEGMEREMRDINHVLREIQDRVRNL